jgi:hypothetical protein
VGALDERVNQVTTYDDDARVLSIVRTTDTNADGTINARDLNTWEYDANGFLTTVANSSDQNNDGVIDRRGRQVNTYDANGAHLSFLEEYDFDNDGIPDQSSANSWEYAPVQNGVVPLGYQYFPEPDGYAYVVASP